MKLHVLITGIFFALFLILGPGIILDHKIDHGYPYAFSASDAFQHQIRMEFIKDQGHYRTEASYTQGGEEGVLGYYQPVLFHLAVLLHHATGYEVYQVGYLILFLFAIVAMLLLYDLLHHWNEHIALLSLPFMFFLFSQGPTSGFTWGHWPAMLASTFVIALAWSLPRLTQPKGWVLTSLFMAALAMTHGSEFVYALFLTGIYSIWYLATHPTRASFLKSLAKAASLALLTASYSLLILYQVWMRGYNFQLKVITDFPGFGYVISSTTFGGYSWIMLLGIAAALLFWNKRITWPILFGLSYLVFGYSNYVGFDWRAVTQRFWWPVTLAVFFGITLYLILKFSKQLRYAIPVTVLFTFLIVFSIETQPVTGSMDPYHWETFNWIAQNTPQHTKVFFLYGDLYGQDAMLRNTKRFHVVVDTQDYAARLNNQEISRYYRAKKPADWSGFAYWDNFPHISHRNEELWPTKFQDHDICAYDLIVADKVAFSSQSQPLVEYNAVLFNTFIRADWITPVFENDMTIILHNSKPGTDCIIGEVTNETI